MADDKATVKGPHIIIGPGVFVFPYLNEPDEYKGNKNYKCNLSIESSAMADIEAACDAFAEKANTIIPNKKGYTKRPWESDDYEGREDNILVKTKCGASFAPTLYDAKKEEMSRDIPVWGNTVGKLRVQLIAYPGLGGGIMFRLKAAQILDLKTAGGDSEGFDEEDGYVAPEVDTSADIVPSVDTDGEDEGMGDEPDF